MNRHLEGAVVSGICACGALAGRKALTPELAHTFYSAVKSPKHEPWLDSQGQIDFYDDPKLSSPPQPMLSPPFCAERSHVPTSFEGRRTQSGRAADDRYDKV